MNSLVTKSVEEGVPPESKPDDEFPPFSEWGDGPWKAEGNDSVSVSGWQTIHLGLQCQVIRNQLGAWCGYVRLPDTHPWTSLDALEDIPVTVHGGVSFIGTPEFDDSGRGIWIGFDCGHFDDYVPGLEASMKKISPGHKSMAEMLGIPIEIAYKNFRFATEQTMEMAAQVIRWGT